ncbi:MAG: S49 family peptidase [Candidatus Thiodiazotropha endolucinida]|nr:S49 family peptidase [Candidatus Thiodiazotropha taylori]MCW4263702.1 S49 family peptidase [Candidatus Thiodiazotropha endolucinida]
MDITHPYGGLMTGRPMCLERKAFEHLQKLSAQSISERQLLNAKPPDHGRLFAMHDSIAIIDVHGALSKRAGPFDAFFGIGSYEVLEDQFLSAVDDPDVIGILLDIDSPGGEVSGLFDLADLIYAARDDKPIWAVANDDAFSAAYALASAAEKVFVTRTGGVGSIGVIASHVDQSAFDEKLGVKYTTVFAGGRKNDFDPHNELTSEATALLQTEINRLYQLFTKTVARNRGLSEAKVTGTEAGLFFGNDAVNAGLADGVMTFSDALQEMVAKHSKAVQPKRMRKTMTQETPKTEAQAAETQEPDTPVTQASASETILSDQEKDALMAQAQSNAKEALRAEITAISKACEIAGMPEKLGAFIEQGLSADQAKDELMKLMAAKNNQQPEIHTQTLPAKLSENEESPVVKAAKARAQISQS